MNQIIEVVRQLRGQSPAQVEDAELGLVEQWRRLGRPDTEEVRQL